MAPLSIGKGRRHGLSFALLCLLSPTTSWAQTNSTSSPSTSTVTTAPTDSPATTATPIEFPINLPKFSCPTSGATETPGEPIHLSSITTGNGDKTILLAPLEADQDGDVRRMCILSRWSLGQIQQANKQGHYHPLGRSIPSVSNGDWTKPPGRPARELDYICGVASNSGAEFSAGEYLCQVTLPWTRKIHPDFSHTNIYAPYYITYYERYVGVRTEMSRFLHKSTFGPRPQDLDEFEAAYDDLMNKTDGSSLTSAEAISKLQVEWTKAQMDPSTFSSGSFSSLRRYWRKRVNARAFEVYKIGESGPGPCEKHSRWRKFAFTKYDVQNARYLKWGDDGVVTQSQQPHKITVQTIDLRSPTLHPVSSPTPLPVSNNLPTISPVLSPSLSPTISSAPSGSNLLGYGDFEIDPSHDNSTKSIDVAWVSSCNTNLLDIATDDPAAIHSGSKSYNVTGGACSVLRFIGTNCPANHFATNLQEGDTIKISLWVKISQGGQVFQMFTGHYHPQKTNRWGRPKDDSHVISRTLIDNANKWKFIEAYHTVGNDWTFGGEILKPKLCNHYQLRFNLAKASTASYIMDDVRISRVGGFSQEEKQVLFLRNPNFVAGHNMWKLSATSGTIAYDDELNQNVMQIKKGNVLRQVITSTSVPGESYSFGFWVRLINSSRPVTLKIILRMRFTNNDRVYGPCKNPICNLYKRPVIATLAGGSDSWQYIMAKNFDMYGDYTTWDGNVDFILFQVTTTGMPNGASLRIANFHDLKQGSVPPSLSLVPSSTPTTLYEEDLAYVVSYAGSVRTVLKHPFQVDKTGEVLPMDGSVEYMLCDVEEVEGSLSKSIQGLRFLIDGKCSRIRGGNPTVHLDPRYLDLSGLHILDLSSLDANSISAINTKQTYGGDLLLLSSVQDEVCDTFPSPYDNDYRGANEENPDAVPNRFEPDDPIFAKLPDGSYALYDPRLILHENSLENPLLDGGGGTVLRSSLRAKAGITASQRGSSKIYQTTNDQNVVLCANEQPNFLNRDHCVLSYEENACIADHVNGNQRHVAVNVEVTLTFDNVTLAALHSATAESYREANETAGITAVDSKRYIYAVSNLRYDNSNTNGLNPLLPCSQGNPRSRWIPRQDLDASSCTNDLEASSTAVLAKALESSNDANIYMRDIYLWNSVAEDGCDATDLLEYGMLIMTSNEGCWQNVHPDHMSIYDFTKYVMEHPTSNPPDTSITSFASEGILEYPDNHPMAYFESLKDADWEGLYKLLTPIARYGDMMIVDELASITGIHVDPVALAAVAELGDIKLNNVIDKNRGGGVLVCGSPNEVSPDPELDDNFDVVHDDLNCVGCQKSYGDYFAQKQTVWTINAIEAEDQLCSRMAWALYELVNVGTTTAPDNTESNLYTYDIFQRHCFGNYYDILKEMSYNPKMGEQFGYVLSTSTRWRYDMEGLLVYPDENYAREIMQLYTIGLHYLDETGTERRDKFGRVIQTYTNSDILSNSRIWSGFDYTARRGNVEELFRAHKSRHDPMRIRVDMHDFLPKLTLGSWVGTRYPLCSDLPNQPFLKIGAEYHLRGGSSIPASQSLPESRDGNEQVKRFVLSRTSSLYNKLCNSDGAGVCQYRNTVVLDENLPCDGKECRVDTLVIIQVAPGVFYEHIRQPCVQKTFYSNARKVVTGSELNSEIGRQYSYAMCADPLTASAARSCCDAEGKSASYNYKFEYHGETVTATTNEQKCTADGLSVCDPITVVAEEPVVITKPSYSLGYPSGNRFYWTDALCNQYLKIRSDGMVAVINDVTKNTAVAHEKVVPFVSLEGSVTFITMPWLQDTFTLDYLYPSSQDNSCDNGACSTLDDGSCLCPVTTLEESVFSSLPNRTEVLTNLHVGAFNPSVYLDSSTPFTLVDSSSDVEAYSSGTIEDASTIFKVTDDHGETLYVKNTKLSVTIGSSYTMENPVTFMNLAKIDELDATYEIDAFLKLLMKHENTPSFVSKKLVQYFGVSNPTPGYVMRVSQSFKQGYYSKDGISFGDGTYGNLAAVAAAIILDPEAINVVVDNDPVNGNVREPLLKVIQTLRGLEFKRREEVKLSTGLLKNVPWKIGQMVFQPPDQFSFFSSDYSPPGFFSSLEMVSPESELLSMSSLVGITNAFFSLINFGLSNADGGLGPYITNSRVVGDYSSSVGQLTYEVNGADIAAKIDDLDVIMTGGRLSAGNKQVLTKAYEYFIKSHGSDTADKVLMALALASPEFHTSNVLKTTGTKRTVTPPATKSSEPYKAIVYIYLGGGIDSFNILTPHNEGECHLYDDYFQARGGSAGVGLTIDEILTIDGTSAGIEGCNTFGVNKLMSAYKQIYDEGKGIFLANMGHLHKPVSKSNWMTETRTDLFSHHSMKREAQFVDAFREGAGPGVLGRMCDVLESKGHAVSATSVNVQAPMVEGDPAKGRYADAMSTEGLPKIFDRQFLNARTGQEFRLFLEELNGEMTDNSGVLANHWSQRLIDVWDKTDKLVEVMRGTKLQTAFSQLGPDIGSINQQLKLVAQLMLNRDKRGNGVNRDVFYVEMGGFDTHSEMASIMKSKIPALNRGVGNFWAEMKAQGLESSVTVVQGSEFGRTISANSNDGTDHAWGGNYFIFGGDVAGGKILGNYPTTFDDSDSRNIGRGRLIPSRSWDSLWYGIAQWFGITDQADIDYVLPNSGNFGCDLFTDKDLFTSGTYEIQGCGGPSMGSAANMEITEPRMLTGEEQKGLCKIATNSASKQLGINAGDARCFISDMVVTPVEGRRRLTGEEEQLYTVSGVARLNFDKTIPQELASPTRINDIMTVASKTASDRVVVGAIPRTEAPSASPSMAPSASSAPSTDTASPTRAPVAPLGLPFLSLDIGYCAYDGESYETNGGGEYVLSGSGADIWGTSDAFHYMYVETSGDADVAVFIESFSFVHPWAKVGVMFRRSLAKDSAHYSALLTGNNGPAQQVRRYNGLSSENVNIASVNPFNPLTRFVKISRPDWYGNFNILEVQVFDHSNNNVALGGTASQSSTYLWSGTTACPATLAIDGNTALQQGTTCDGLAHTNAEQGPWLMIDLGDSYDISKVVIWNRMNCCSEKLSFSQVLLLDNNSNLIRKIDSIGDTSNVPSIQLNIQDFEITAPLGIWMRVTKVGNVMTAFYKQAWSSFWVPFGNQLAVSAINSNSYYIGVAITDHSNNSPQMATAHISNVDLHRKCTSDSITSEQCDQATNCELGYRTNTCYDAGIVLTRRVKIHLPKKEYLHLAEVEVFNEYGENVALYKPASMSSVYDPYYFPYPAAGTDGIIVDSMFHTNIQQDPWWEVDLQDMHEVKEVAIYNRNHACDTTCQARVNGAIVSLIDSKGRVFDTKDVGVVAQEDVGVVVQGRRLQAADPQPIGLTFIGTPIGSFLSLARKVKVQLTDTNYLHLLEVQVFDESGSNRALNKPATMSSAYEQGEDPGLGVDGITSGLDPFHTDIEYGAWWEVDLIDVVHVRQVILFNPQLCDGCQQRLSNAVVSLIDGVGDVFDQKNVGDTAGVNEVILNFVEVKKSVLPPKELEAPGHFEYFGGGWCRDSDSRMYDYLRYHMEGVTPQMCQNKCMILFSGLVGLSTYSSYYCYCWYENGELPSPLPFDAHAYSTNHQGTGEITLTLNEADGDCFKFLENVVDTETPTLMPTDPPSVSPTYSPSKSPTRKPTAKPTNNFLVGSYTYMGNGWCRDSKNTYYDYNVYRDSVSVTDCPGKCEKSTAFRGFSLYEPYYCYCWYDNGQRAQDPTAFSYYDGFVGSGEITMIYYTGYSKCWKFTPDN